MMKLFGVSILCLLCYAASADTASEESTLETVSGWRDKAKKSLGNIKQATGADKRYLLSSYRLASNNYYTGDFYCDTSYYLTGHKFVDGAACQINYNFVARNDWEGTQIQGSFMKSQRAESCEDAEKICKKIKLSFKETGDQLDILNQNAGVAQIFYKNGLPGFLPQ